MKRLNQREPLKEFWQQIKSFWSICMPYFLLLDYVLLISIGLPDYQLKFYKFTFAVLLQMFTIIIMKDLTGKKNIPYQLL